MCAGKRSSQALSEISLKNLADGEGNYYKTSHGWRTCIELSVYKENYFNSKFKSGIILGGEPFVEMSLRDQLPQESLVKKVKLKCL